jgi:hypothetical protein
MFLMLRRSLYPNRKKSKSESAPLHYFNRENEMDCPVTSSKISQPPSPQQAENEFTSTLPYMHDNRAYLLLS